MADTTYQPKTYRKQGGEEHVIANGGTLRVESGGTVVLESGSTFTAADGVFEPPDLALAQGSIMIGDSDGEAAALSVKGDAKILVGNGTTATSVSVSGDITMTNAGVVALTANSVITTDITDANVTAAKLATAAYPISVDINKLVKQAAWKDALPDAPDATSLGLGDAAGSVVTGTTTNGGATASASETAAFSVQLPDNYVDGGAIELRVRAKVSADRQTSQTVDAVVKLLGDSLGSDICADAAQTLTTSYANYDFTITPTGLVAGDVLWVEITLATDDTAGSPAANSDGYPTMSAVSIRPTVRV